MSVRPEPAVNSPKRQHTIPIVHLKHFVGADPKGQVWTIDKDTGEARSATPENTSVVSHFYSVQKDDGSFDTTLEEALAEIESAAGPVYDKLLRGEVLSDDERVAFAAFLAAMYLRTTAKRLDTADIIGHHMQILSYAYGAHDGAFAGLVKRFEKGEGRTLTEEEKKTMKAALLDPTRFRFAIPKERTLMVFGAYKELIPIFFDMNWCVIRAAHGFFITSDNPVVRWVNPSTRHPIYGDHGFQNKTVEVTFPLAPKAVLMAAWQSLPPHFVLDRDDVWRMNKLRASHADKYLFAHICSRPLKILATTLKGSRPRFRTEGFGPKEFGPIDVPRRRK